MIDGEQPRLLEIERSFPSFGSLAAIIRNQKFLSKNNKLIYIEIGWDYVDSDRNVRNYVDNKNMHVDTSEEHINNIQAFLRELLVRMEIFSFLTRINYSELMMEKNSYEN